MQKATRAALFAAAAAALVTLPGLGAGTLWDNSETTYGEVAREIVLSGDWIVMHHNGAPWFVQPPLYFWIGAIFIKLFGLSALALRLPSALATIGMGAVVAYILVRRSGERAGLYCGIILSTCLMQAVIGRLAIMDALLDLSVALTILWWLSALQSGRVLPFVAGWIACAFGVLAKGPVAPAISLLVIAAFIVWERRYRRIEWPGAAAWLISAGAFLVIVAPWFLSLASESGFASVIVLIGHYTFGRYTGTIENQSGPFWYYIPALVIGFFPWIAYLPSAIGFAFSRARDERSSIVRLSLMWTLLPFLFFSFAHTKLPNYIALEMPALAVLVALFLDDVVDRVRSRALVISTAAVPVFIVLMGVAIAIFTRQNRLGADLNALQHDLVFLGLALFLGSAVAFVMLWMRPPQTANSPFALASAMIVATAVLAIVMLPQAETLKPIPHLAAIVNARARARDKIAILNASGGNALVFYTHPGIKILNSQPDADAAICKRPGRTFLIVKQNDAVPEAALHPKVDGFWAGDVLYEYQNQC